MGKILPLLLQTKAMLRHSTVVLDAVEYETKALQVIGKRQFGQVKKNPASTIEIGSNKHLWGLRLWRVNT